MNYEIVPIETLRPLEKVFPTHLKNLEGMIDKDGFMLKALIVDKTTGTILDGSHRYVYLLKRGYKTVPVYFVNYSDENIRVGTNLVHRFLIDGDVGISKRECVHRALSNKLFNPRTTRHFFPFRKDDISLPLSSLDRGKPEDVRHLILNVSILDELAHNRKYIKEINEETEVIIKYLSEVSQTKQYLTEQINQMENKQVAFFPGKFHPPHLGHLKTLLDLNNEYSKLIIGVSEHMPADAVTTVENIISILTTLFKNNPSIEVVRIKGTLVHKKDIKGLPTFDILLSGNPDVLAWADKLDINNKFIGRANGELFSGTEIRDEL